jgi:hypothetical protein
LVPVMALAERAGLSELISGRVAITAARVASAGANPAGKQTSIVAGMAAGAHSVDDVDVVRSGGMAALFDQVYARPRWASSCASSPMGTPSSWRRWRAHS